MYREQQIFTGIPAEGGITDAVNGQLLKQLGFFVISQGVTSSMSFVIEVSVDNVTWSKLGNTLTTVGPDNPVGTITMQHNPFQWLRLRFVTIASGGDAFEVRIGSKGDRS